MDAETAAAEDTSYEAPGWVCGCGTYHWILFANGECLCTGCGCVSTVIEVVRRIMQ
jgi:hypothetical protein